MRITLSQDEVTAAVRAYASTTLPQLNFDDADIVLFADCAEIDVSTVAPVETKAPKAPVKTTRKPRKTKSEPTEESEAEIAPAKEEAVVADTATITDEDEAPWATDEDVKATVPFGLEDTKKPSASLFGA